MPTLAKKKTTTRTGSKSDAIRAVIAAHPKATRTEIKAKLQARGVKASDALVNKVKYDRKRTGAKATSKGRKNSKGVSKADAIRNMFGAMGLDARPRDIIAALKARGVVVTSAQVSTLRSKLSKDGSGVGPTVGEVSLAHLMAAKQLAARLGGIASARQALDSLAELVEA
jgi:uncharacterized protein YneF (UPF0154 family)